MTLHIASSNAHRDMSINARIYFWILRLALVLLSCLARVSGSVHFKLGYKLPNSVEITTFSMLSIDACIQGCQARPGCLSIEINPLFRLCRLGSSDTFTMGTPLIRSPGTWFSEKSDWTEKTIDQRCNDMCSTTETCKIDGGMICEVAECPKPQLLDNSSTILGSLRSVGSSVLHVCPDRSTRAVSVCGQNGQWSLEQFTCSIVLECPTGWEKFEDSCYLFDNSFRSFASAKAFCLAEQALVVHVESTDENTFIKDYLSGLPMADYWMGMTDEAVEGQWKWYSSNADAGFLDWNPGEASSNINENCAVFGDTIAYRWADVTCSSNRKTVCEIDHGAP